MLVGMMRQFNRTAHTLAAARSDWWEAGYYIEASRIRSRRTAKRDAARAARRLARHTIAMEIA